jgi:ATP-dependent protease ClpP protease subunit
MSDPIGEVHAYGVDLKNREVFLHGYHGQFEEDPGVEYRMATTFIKNIRTLDSLDNQPIVVHMHSAGGNWSDGMAIYDTISLCKSHVAVLAYGQAESMSSIILQAADLRIMMPNAHFMTHYGSSGYDGDYLSVQNASRFEKSMVDTMINIYAEKCIKGKFFNEHYKSPTLEKVKGYLKRKLKSGDWYLGAHEAVYYGFADGVITGRKYENINSLK